jgi:uncharacterized protein (UPF0276 family)
MKLAINYSSAAGKLVQSRDIEIDYFKTPDWSWMVEEAQKIRPVATHFNLEAGNGQLHKVDWEEVDRLAKSTQTPFVNLHIDPRQKYHPDVASGSEKNSDKKRILKCILSDVDQVVDRFGSNRVILENSPYRGEFGNTLRLGVEPDIISKVVEETGCGLLLDISHAIIASHYIGMDTYEYFSRLPTDKVLEMHFAGIHRIKGVWTDHLSILKKNWRWLDWSLGQIQSANWSQPWLLAFEYGGVGKQFEWRTDPKVIRTQVPLIYARVNRANQNQT